MATKGDSYNVGKIVGGVLGGFFGVSQLPFVKKILSFLFFCLLTVTVIACGSIDPVFN